jgi:enoyl-CoA hydratase
VQGAKQVLNFGINKSIGGGLDYVATWNFAFLQSHDFNEMVAASMERRKAVFNLG